ncbi:MAG TPA: alpha/beta hydrolase [Solirubrobacteraceae bacterium]|nr:alpha/beta hydrolase [Solirubrobacteraceae bacterium]
MTETTKALRAREITVKGLSSPVIEAGPADVREAVVFVHGNPGSSTDWTMLVGAVGEHGRRAVAFDMPGFGRAEKPRDFDYQVGAYADFIQGALAELGIERVHLVVHDFGGPFGLLWGLQHADAWASVVLINIGILPGYKWHTMAKRWRTPVLGELVQAWIPRSGWRRAMARANPKGLPAEFVEKMYDEYDRGTRRAVLKLYRATPDADTPGMESVQEQVGAELAKLHKPALVVWGAADPFLSVKYAERQREFFDVRDVVILPDSAHWPFQDDPQAVAQAVVPFLREQLSAAAAA